MSLPFEIRLDNAYGDSAAVYDALCAHKDYAAASAEIVELVRRICPNASRLLDIGCGTGRHLEHLGQTFEAEGLDRSHRMLELARARCPGMAFHEGDLVDFDLGRTFDVVCCLFGAIGFARTTEGLERAIAAIGRHLSPGGVAVVERWLTPEEFVDGRVTLDTVREADLAVARAYVSCRDGSVSVFESEYIVATPAGVARFAERLELGLFTAREYRRAFDAAGLDVVQTTASLFGYGVIAAVKPAGSPNG
jgi:SAM-dependent methyltransferase